ncbi:piggyBac transposable element-derived protein 3-like isoform X1 [Myxocyprinus asiaticus]|uniref:piggyBac transposable element-derived protein 3-like isoform X1 n=1 Tax=Myxocyprinus asiaticus TaxID=70543 RepID=UPI0022219E01|nr:piggyBac transposable element-derived protein 3-like isoform X1 [Myxocyprinus asiaticus]
MKEELIIREPSSMFIMREQIDVIHAGEQQMLQTPVKIEVKQEEIKEENTTEEQQNDDDEQQMLQTPVKIEVKQEEIKEENTAEEQQSYKDDFIPSEIDRDYGSLLSTLKRRRQLTADELRFRVEEDMAHEGMSTQEEDLLDQELLQEDPDHEEMEDEMEPDPQPRPSTGMPPARKGPVYSVQDVLAIIQNGESDFELDSDDSDASDRETDEDAGEVDRENQQPTDCPDDHYEDIELQPKKPTMPRDRYRWLKRDFVSPNTDFSGPDVTSGDVSIHTPLEYFQRFVSEDMLQALTQNTNEYSFQKTGRSVNTNKKEIEKVIGIYLKMGLVQMSGVSMYWETALRYNQVSDVMSRNRFQELLRSLHFVNNLTVPETEKTDKLWKLRPWLDSFREKCLQVVPEEHNSVDEMMIPFKGKFSGIKQYLRGKPHPWGFKLWVRRGISGMVCDFEVYQGSVNGHRAKSELGLSGDVVMKLASTLPEGQNYKIFADNYFTCIPLVVQLLRRGIHYMGTARQVCLLNCNLADEKSLKKSGRGSFDFRVEGNHNICAVKWFDNRAVTLVSSFAGPEPVQKIKRWDKATKTYIEVERPYIVGTYNKFMGGLDLLDSFAAKYKYCIKSKRWYLYIFWHTIILAVINAWLLYKRDCKALKILPKEMLNRRQFQAELADSLILVNTTPIKPKRGRPSSDGGSPVTETVTSRSPLNAHKRPSSDGSEPNGTPAKRPSAHPPVDVRRDMVAHLPVKTTRGRCRLCKTGYTNTLCRKCNVRLCFSEDKNCLWDYHT